MNLFDFEAIIIYKKSKMITQLPMNKTKKMFLTLKIKFLVITIFGLGFVNLCTAQLTATYVNNAYDMGNGCYTITNNAQSNSGAAWYNNPIDLTADFDIVFNAYFGANPNGADGMTFVLKTTPNPVLGGIGGGLGYEDRSFR